MYISPKKPCELVRSSIPPYNTQYFSTVRIMHPSSQNLNTTIRAERQVAGKIAHDKKESRSCRKKNTFTSSLKLLTVQSSAGARKRGCAPLKHERGKTITLLGSRSDGKRVENICRSPKSQELSFDAIRSHEVEERVFSKNKLECLVAWNPHSYRSAQGWQRVCTGACRISKLGERRSSCQGRRRPTMQLQNLVQRTHIVCPTI